MSTRFGRFIVGATINPVAPNKPLPFKENVIISQQLRAPPATIFTSCGCALTCSPPRLYIYLLPSAPLSSQCSACFSFFLSRPSVFKVRSFYFLPLRGTCWLRFRAAKAAINTSTPWTRVWRVAEGRHCVFFVDSRMMHHHIWLEKPDILKSVQVPLGLRACDVSVFTWNRYAGLRAWEPLVPPAFCSPTQGRARDVTRVPLVRVADRSLGRPHRISRVGGGSRNNFVPMCPNFQMFLYFLIEAGAGGFGW